MPRYRITLEYDGGPFVGWQRQPTGPSVQAALEAALLALSGETVTVRGAGRTDAGVHATGQVAHFDLVRARVPDRLRDGLNAHLRPHPITVLAAAETAEDFDARFSATRRGYRYRILSRRVPPALDRDRVWHVRGGLDVAAMTAGAAFLLGHHDFSTFRAADCQARSPMKTLDRFDIVSAGVEIHVIAEARSFLHSQVRSMVGTLAKVGTGAWTPARVGEALAARDRKACGPLAPPHALYLEAVGYDPLRSGEIAVEEAAIDAGEGD